MTGPSKGAAVTMILMTAACSIVTVMFGFLHAMAFLAAFALVLNVTYGN